MDTDAIERAGAAPLSGLLALVEAAATGAKPVAEAVAELHKASVPVFFGLGAPTSRKSFIPRCLQASSRVMDASVRLFFAFFSGDGPDAKRSTWSIAQVHQGGLGLPDRDYYFDADKADIRTKCGCRHPVTPTTASRPVRLTSATGPRFHPPRYVAHVALMLELADAAPDAAKKAAEAVMEVESKIAAAHLTRVERRDPELTYNKACACHGPEGFHGPGGFFPLGFLVPVTGARAHTPPVLHRSVAEWLRAIAGDNPGGAYEGLPRFRLARVLQGCRKAKGAPRHAAAALH